MSSFDHNYPIFFAIFSIVFFPCFITSAPVPEDDNYNRFINFLLQSNCTMPKEVKLPFPVSSDTSPFSYLSNPLNECRTSEKSDENYEANLLCKEIFEVLQNITCYNIKPLSEIDSDHLSEDVCNDFKVMHDLFPMQNDYLSRKLADDVICQLLCTKDNKKYESLCKTLLWSYDTQAKLNALQSENEDGNQVSSNKGNEKGTVPATNPELIISPKIMKVSLFHNKSDENNLDIDKKTGKLTDTNKEVQGDELPNDSNPKNSDHAKQSSIGLQETSSQSTSNKIDTSTTASQGENVSKISSTIKSEITVPNKSDAEIKNQELPNEVDRNVKITKPSSSSSMTSQNKEIKQEENEINSDEQAKNVQIKEKVVDAISDANSNSLLSNNNGIKDLDDSEGKTKPNINTNTSTKTSGKSEESPSPTSETDNDLNTVNFQEQENISKVKTDLISDDKGKHVEKPKITDFEPSNEESPDFDSKLSESSTLQILPDDDAEPHQEDKDQEQYNSSYNNPLKNREPDVKSSIIADSNQVPNNYENFMSQRNNIARVPDNIAMIPSFPEQEDSHFFFYFLSIVLILMAGYLIFHNKQKIIALIVEGRHERRRRSHGAGYKKLETK